MCSSCSRCSDSRRVELSCDVYARESVRASQFPLFPSFLFLTKQKLSTIIHTLLHSYKRKERTEHAMRTAVQTLKRAVASSSSSSSSIALVFDAQQQQQQQHRVGVASALVWTHNHHHRSNFLRTSTSKPVARFSTEEPSSAPSPLQRAPVKPSSARREEKKELADQLGQLKIHPSATDDKIGEEVFYAVKKNAKGSTKRFQAFLKILRGGLTVEEALIQCKLSPKKKVANELYQLINSAKFNAIVGLGREPEDGYVDANCVISKATATKGQYLKRMYVKAKGQAGIMHRARTHIRVELREQEAGKRMRVFDPNDEERAKIGQEEGKPPFEPPWIARRKQGEKRYKMAKEAGIL